MRRLSRARMRPPGTPLSRRRVLRGLAASAAAALAASGRLARATAAPASPEWEQTLAAAKKEGKVAVNTFTGQGYARVFKLFTRAYPEIKLDHTNLEPVDFTPRLIQERKADPRAGSDSSSPFRATRSTRLSPQSSARTGGSSPRHRGGSRP